MAIIADEVLRAKAQEAFVPNGSDGSREKSSLVLGILRPITQPHTFSWGAPKKGLCTASLLLCRTLLIVTSIALLVFPIYQGMTDEGIAEAAPGECVSATLNLESDGGSDIFLEAPDSISDWVLVPSSHANSRQILLDVKANMGWQMTVASDRPDGRMAQYDLTQSEYVPGGRTLESPMSISASGTSDHPQSWNVNLPAGGMIQQGDETSEDGQKVSVTLGQAVAWNDEPLPEGQAYRIALMFAVSPSG